MKLLLVFCLFASVCLGQQKEEFLLPEQLNEISGLEQLSIDRFVAINDGGNDPLLIILDKKGCIQQKIVVNNAKNNDWEDLAKDDTYLYIGDIGNNANQRKDLAVLRVKLSDLDKEATEVSAEKINYSYAEQKDFPPAEDNLLYDAEGMIVQNDSIWIFTKNRVPAKTTSGKTYIYKFPVKPGSYKPEVYDSIYIGKSGWLKDGVTAADYQHKNLYLLTYKDLYVFKMGSKGFEKQKTVKFDSIDQRESVLYVDGDTIFVADERHPLLGKARIYTIKP